MSETIFGRLRSLLVGTPQGGPLPTRRPEPDALAVDGRTTALTTFADYIAELTFFRPGGVERDSGKALPSIPFKVPRQSIYVEWPDDVDALTNPSMVLLGGEPADYAPQCLTPFAVEATRDKFGAGTVLWCESEIVERVYVIPWVAERAERRSILAGLEAALSPMEEYYGLLFKLPAYYGMTAKVAPLTRTIIEDPDAARRRRHAAIACELRLPLVRLRSYMPLQPLTQTLVDEDC